MFSFTLKNKTAFTLAEVLITLGIIGIVAALTLPALNQHYKRQEVETRLQKFYSTMNQALKQSELDNGDFTTWEYNIKTNGRDNDTNVEWYNKYLAPYLKPLKVDIDNSNNYVLIYFTDGSMVLLRRAGTTYNYFPNAKNYEKLKDEFIDIETIGTSTKILGKDCFLFAFMPEPTPTQNGWDYHKNKGIEPYRWYYRDGGATLNLKSTTGYGCSKTGTKQYCTAVIQENGWKIPKDYPVRF